MTHGTLNSFQHRFCYHIKNMDSVRSYEQRSRITREYSCANKGQKRNNTHVTYRKLVMILRPSSQTFKAVHSHLTKRSQFLCRKATDYLSHLSRLLSACFTLLYAGPFMFPQVLTETVAWLTVTDKNPLSSNF